MSVLSAEVEKTLKYDRDAVFRCTLGYGLIGILISAPVGVVGFVALGIPGPERLVIEAAIEPTMDGPPIPANMFSHAVHLFGLWTIGLPIIVSVLLLYSAWLAHRNSLRALIWFSNAYKFMRMGGIFSGLPLIPVLGIWIAYRADWEWGAFIVPAISFLPALYYVALWRISRVYDQLSTAADGQTND